MRNERGQIGLEYIMIVGAVLLITIPLFFYAIYETNYKIRLNQADDAVNTLANAADTVYSMGPGSKKYVWISIPSGVTSTPEDTVNENDIILTLSIFGGSSDIHASSKAVMVGSVPIGKGTYRIAVEALEAGRVRIGEEYTDITPPVILRVYPETEPGQVICPGFVVLGADTDEPATCKYNSKEEGDVEYGAMLHTFDGRGLTHISTIYTDIERIYIFYARCQDPFNNTMTESAIITFETGTPCGVEGTGNLTLNLSDDIGPPEVHLISPPDDYMHNYSWVDFEYNVIDTNNSIDFCLLVAEGENYQGDERVYFGWDSQPERGITQNMTIIIEKGNYTWYVNCTDNSTNHNTDQSVEIWDVEVTRTFIESFLNSCAGWCGWQGFVNGGDCRQNPGKCDDLGPCYSSDPDPPVGEDCYVGDTLSDEYCAAGMQAPSCCCRPN